MNKKFTILTAALALLTILAVPIGMWGQDPETWSHAFVSPEAVSSNAITVDGATWTISTTPGAGSPTISTGNYSSTYGLKFGSSKSVYFGSVTFSTDYFNSYNVQSVTVNILNNGSKQGTFTAQQGSTTIGSDTKTFGQTWTNLTANTTPGSGGTLSFTYSVEQAFYIHAITVTYTTGSSTTYTITPVSNNDAYGTVSLSGTTITATPSSGYRVIAGDGGYTVTVGTATVTNNGNNTFTVTPSSDCTVRINFEAIPTYTVTFNLDGGTFSPNGDFPTVSGTIVEGTHTLPSATKTGTNFAGWKDDDTDMVYAGGESFTVSDDVSFTAQWSNTVTATYTIETRTSVSLSGTAPSGSTATFLNTYTSNKNQITKDNSMTLTLSGYDGYAIKGITLRMHSNNSSGAGSLSVMAGTTSIASISDANFNDETWYGDWSNPDYVNVTPTISNSTYVIQSSENVVITIAASANSLFCESFTIEYEASTEPVINADDVVIAAAATSGEIAYTISNPDGSTLTAAEKTPGYDWIDAVTVVGAENKVTFTTTANDGARREGYITLTYGSVTKDVKVTQAGPTYTVTYAANEGTGEMTDTNSPYEVGAEVTLLANTFTAPEGKLWGGWQVTDALHNDIPVTGGKFTMPASNVTVTAIWRGTATYTLVTSSAELVPGKHYVIASGTGDNVYAMGSQSSNNRPGVATTVDSGTTLAEVAGVYEFVISGDGTNYTIYDETNNGYLYAASSSSNYLRTQTTNDANGLWTITFNENAAVITAQGDNTHKLMQYNSSSKLFSCYSSSQAAIYLYKKDGETDYNFYSNTTLASATIAADETYTVHSGATLNVTTSLTNAATSEAWNNLVIKDGAQLKTPNAVKGTIEKAITGYSSYSGSGVGGYYLLATPATMDACNETGMWPTGDQAAQANIDFYSFDQRYEGAEWRNFKYGYTYFAGPLCMNQGQGYLYANPNDVTLTLQTRGYVSPTSPYEDHPFAATNANINVPMSYNGSKPFAGYNLLGNPFTCNAYINRAYYRMNDAGDAIIAAASATTAIKPCEGIFVLAADGDDNSVTFSTTVPSGAAPANVVINLKDSEMVRDRAIVSFGNERNMPRFQFNEAAAKLYIPQGEKEMAKVNSEAQGEMPVNFKADKNGSYTLSIDIEADMDYLHLIDNMTGADVDLLANPSYTFDARTSDYASRFRLVFSANDENGASTGSATFAYFNGSEWVVNSNGNATLQVVDVMGRVLSSETVNGNHTMNLNLSTGVYMLRLVNGNDVKTQKIVVR